MGAVSTTTIADLHKERSKIVAEIEELQEGLGHVDWVLQRMEADTADATDPDTNGDRGIGTMAENIERMLKDSGGGPMKLIEIVEAMVGAGLYPDDGKKLYNRVAATLSAAKQRFQRVSTGTYKLVDGAIRPPANDPPPIPIIK